MSVVLDKILVQNDKIERDISRIETFDKGEICASIIEKLRTFVEHIAMYHYLEQNELPHEIIQKNIEYSILFMKNDKHILFLSRLHMYLQACASHYVIDETTSTRLMFKYAPFLFRIKKWIKKVYDIEILSNFADISKLNDSEQIDYYTPIKNKLIAFDYAHNSHSKDRYYVHSCHPVFVNDMFVYEITLGIASDYASKFNRFIVFSNEEIPTNYSIKCEFSDYNISVKNYIIKVRIVQDWCISIRPCEFENYGSIFGLNEKVESKSQEYTKLMTYLMENRTTILDIICSDSLVYNSLKKDILSNTEVPHIFNIFDKAREFALGYYNERKLVKYLAYNLINKIIKSQRSSYENNINLYLNKGVYPFCSLPFAMSLNNHNPSISDLIEIFGKPSEYELIYRKIRNKTENESVLYHKLDGLFSGDLENVKDNIKKINSKLDWTPSSNIKNFGENYYIEEYETSTIKILEKLFELSKEGITEYSEFAISRIESEHINIDCLEKKDIIISLFANSKIACVYGPAGTGKSYLAKLISQIYSVSKKTYISTTNTAVNNLYRKVGGNINDFMTINKYLSKYFETDVLFIDECSMVSNEDMVNILNKNNFKCLVLMGDIVQIESIKFGNWYKLARAFLEKKSKNDLKVMHRTSSNELQLLWEKTRNR